MGKFRVAQFSLNFAVDLDPQNLKTAQYFPSLTNKMIRDRLPLCLHVLFVTLYCCYCVELHFDLSPIHIIVFISLSA